MSELSITQNPISPSLAGQFFQIPVYRGHMPGLTDRTEQASANSTLDVNSFILGRAGATSYFFDVKTNVFVDDGILAGDKILVDTAVSGKQGDLIIARDDGAYKLMRVFNPDAFEVWGVVTGVIRKLPSSRA